MNRRKIMNQQIIISREEQIHITVASHEKSETDKILDEIIKSKIPFTVAKAATRAEFVQLVEKSVSHLVIADYNFGVFPFLNETREKTAQTPFIVFSELELPQNALKHGLNIY